jgi:NAD+ kinase
MIMKKVKVVINVKKKKTQTLLRHIHTLLKTYGFVLSEKPNLVIAVGGDGTFLHAAHRYGTKGKPILGVNSGGLGFLTDITLDQLPVMLEEIQKKKFTLERRMMVQAQTTHTTAYALNDLTLITRIPGRAVEFSATINKEYICRFIADGIVIATPTGSTAYSLAASGPILLPSTEALIVTAIAPHTLSVRPIVLPAHSVVEITVGKKGKAALVADGQYNTHIKNNDTIRFKKSRRHITLIKSLHTTFFSTLREKMQWGGREDA